MKTLLTILLTLNLFSCGKNNKTNFTQTMDPQGDDDHDSILNYEDARPYINDITIPDVTVHLKNSEKLKTLTYDNKETLLALIKNNLHSKNLQYNTSFRYKILKDEIHNYDFFQNQLDLSISSKHRHYSPKEIEGLSSVSEDLFISDFIFWDHALKYSYKEYIEGLSQKTYRLTIMTPESEKSYYISDKITLQSALKKLNLNPMSSSYEQNEYEHLFWKVFNTRTENFSKRPKAGSSIIFVQTSLSEIENLTSPSIVTTLDPNTPLTQIVSSRLIDFNVRGELLLNVVQSTSIKAWTSKSKSCFVTITQHKDCNLDHRTLKEKTIQLNKDNFSSYYDLYFNGDKILPSKTYTSLRDNHIEVKLKDSVQQKILIYGLMHGNCRSDKKYYWDVRKEMHRVRPNKKTTSQLILNNFKLDILYNPNL